MFSAVGTPPDEDGSADLSYVLAVAHEVGANMNHYLTVVTKSTVPVGTAKLVKAAIREELDRRGVDIEFDVASNPEFLKEGAAIKDFMSPDRVVVGVESERAKTLMTRLYSPFMLNNFRVIFTDIPSAEMIKYAANSMLATRISFMNDIANLCELVGADVNMVRKGIGSDTRIGSKFLYPGCGYGGSCFPKDVKALIKTAEQQGYTMRVLRAVEEVNEAQKSILFRKLNDYYKGQLAGKTVGVSSGTSSEIILQFVLRDAGLTMDDINPIEMDVSGMTTALLSGQIDAAATWSPNTVTIEEQLGDNYLVLGTNTDYSDEVAFPSSFVCLPDYAEENAEVLARFGAAIDKAQQYRAENIEEVAKLLSSELDVPEDTMVAATGEGDWQGAVDCQGDTDTILGYYTAQQQVFLDNGTVEAEVPVEDYVKTDIMEEAYTLSQE